MARGLQTGRDHDDNYLFHEAFPTPPSKCGIMKRKKKQKLYHEVIHSHGWNIVHLVLLKTILQVPVEHVHEVNQLNSWYQRASGLYHHLGWTAVGHQLREAENISVEYCDGLELLNVGLQMIKISLVIVWVILAGLAQRQIKLVTVISQARLSAPPVLAWDLWPAQEAGTREKLSPSDFSDCPAPQLFPPVAWRKPKTFSSWQALTRLSAWLTLMTERAFLTKK